MNKKNAVALIDDLILATKTLSEKIFDRNKLIKPRDSGLVSIESSIIEGVWDGENYDMIAKYIGLSKRYVSNYGGEFWELLTVALQEIGIDKKVTKKSLKALIEVEHEQIRERLANYKNNYSSTTNPIADNHIFLENKQLEPLDNLQLPKGAISVKSKFYIEREVEEKIAQKEIDAPKGLLKVEGAKKTGKTSTLIRLLNYAKNKNYQTVYLDFHLLDHPDLKDLKKLLKWLCANVSMQINLPERINEYWVAMCGGKVNCTTYFEKYLLRQSEAPILLGLDLPNDIFKEEELALDFFSLFRAWYDKNDSPWEKLKIILVYQENRLSLEAKQSPFNIGTTIVLEDFDKKQIGLLAQKYGIKYQEKELEEVIEKVGKHPHSIHKFLKTFAKQKESLAEFVKSYSNKKD